MRNSLFTALIVSTLPLGALAGPYDRTMNFPFIRTGHSGPKSVTHTQTICLPAQTEDCDKVVVDLDRTSSSPNGPAGPGYGINVSQWNDPKGLNSASHSIGGNCLTSTVTVHRKRRQRGWYEGQHTIFGKCAAPIPPENEAGLEQGEVFQHSAKIVCGAMRADLGGVLTNGIIALPGIYAATVNVHNPSYEEIRFRWKHVPAGRAADAGHSKFVHGKIAADNAQYFDCTQFVQKPDEVFDGFFVIEAEAPLDVAVYYTATDRVPDGRVSVDVETVKERVSKPGKDWYCHAQARLDIADPAHWYLDDGSTARTGSQGQLSYAADTGVNGALKPGKYVFERDICLCGTDGKESSFVINWNEIRSDDGIDFRVIHRSGATPPNALIVNNPHDTNPPGPAALGNSSTQVTKHGTNTLRAVVTQKDFGGTNVGNGMHFSPRGTLSFVNGYLGACMGDE